MSTTTAPVPDTSATPPAAGATAKVQQGYGAAVDAVTKNAGPLVGQAKQFAKDRPFAAAALAGVVGLAILNTLRGR